MASIKILIICLLYAGSVQAQTFAEWFSQKKTQKKYLLAQIAALNSYGGYVRAGYQIAKGGLGTITDAVGDEFKKHTIFYDRLKNVDPALRNDPKVKEILVWQMDIVKQTKEWQQVNVRSALMEDCETQLTALSNILSSNVEMSDAERLTQLSAIHAAMLSNFQFARRYSAQTRIYEVHRAREGNSIKTLKGLYENH